MHAHVALGAADVDDYASRLDVGPVVSRGEKCKPGGAGRRGHGACEAFGAFGVLTEEGVEGFGRVVGE